MAEKYPTFREYREYLKTLPSTPEEMRAKLQRKIEEKHRKGYKSTDLYIEQDD